MQREARSCRVLFARYRTRATVNPRPLNRLAVSPARFVSPATNKQQNERGPISRRATIARETRQIPDPVPPP